MKFLSTEVSSSTGSLLANSEPSTPEVEDPKVPQIEKTLLSDAEPKGKQTIKKTKLTNTGNAYRRDPNPRPRNNKKKLKIGLLLIQNSNTCYSSMTYNL